MKAKRKFSRHLGIMKNPVSDSIREKLITKEEKPKKSNYLSQKKIFQRLKETKGIKEIKE